MDTKYLNAFQEQVFLYHMFVFAHGLLGGRCLFMDIYGWVYGVNV